MSLANLSPGISFRQLIRFLNEQLGEHIEAARLPLELANLIGAKCEVVSIEFSYGRKLMREHHLRPHHWPLIQRAIDQGVCGIDREDLVFILDERDIFHRMFKLVIKSTSNGCELWVKTFYKIDKREAARVIRRCRIVRYQN